MTVEKVKMHFPELPYYLSVFMLIDRGDDLVKIQVESKIHVNKEVVLPTSYGLEWVKTHHKDLHEEVLFKIVRRYGLKRQPVKYD